MEVSKRRRRGSALVEFGIASTVFIVLFSGTYQYGYLFYMYNDLSSAVRSGARFASMSVYDAAQPMVDSNQSCTFLTAVRNVTVYGNPAGAVDGARPVTPGLRPEHVNVNVTFTGGTPSLVTVSIRNYALDAVFGNWVAKNKPSAAFTYMGRYAPPAPAGF